MTMYTLPEAKLPVPPGRFGLPWLGQSLPFVRNPLRWMQREAARHGLVFKTRLIGRPTVFLLGPAANQFVLVDQVQAFTWREGYGDAAYRLFGPALFLQDGVEHEHFRQLLAPAFHGKRMTTCFDQMCSVVDEHLDHWPHDRPLELYHAFKHMAFTIAARVLLGIDSGDDTRRLCALFDQFAAGLFTPFAAALPGSTFGRAMQARAQLLHFLSGVIQHRRRSLSDDAISLLITGHDQRGQPLSNAAISSQLLLLLFAGHDTSASLATWLCYELCRHGEIVRRLRVEQQAVIGSDPLTLERLRELPLLEATIRETERLYPPAPTGFRGAQEAVEYAGYHIPAGWTVVYSPVFTHHMPALFPHPEQWDPDRMLAPRWEQRQIPYSLVGFGGGPRKCIGEGLAQLELKIILTRVLQRIQVELIPGQRVEPAWTPSLHPAHGLWALTKRRSPRTCDTPPTSPLPSAPS